MVSARSRCWQGSVSGETSVPSLWTANFWLCSHRAFTQRVCTDSENSFPFVLSPLIPSGSPTVLTSSSPNHQRPTSKHRHIGVRALSGILEGHLTPCIVNEKTAGSRDSLRVRSDSAALRQTRRSQERAVGNLTRKAP